MSLIGEDFLDWEFEEAGDLERKREAGIVLAGLERVDGLTRDAELISEIVLRPISRRAEFA